MYESDTAEQKLRKHKSNSDVIKQYRLFLNDLKAIDNPETLGDPKTGRHGHYFGYHLTKSVSVLYTVSRNTITILIVDIGDHKQLYMRDNRS